MAANIFALDESGKVLCLAFARFLLKVVVFFKLLVDKETIWYFSTIPIGAASLVLRPLPFFIANQIQVQIMKTRGILGRLQSQVQKPRPQRMQMFLKRLPAD